MDLLHRRGVRGYVTLNTLAFPRSWTTWKRRSGSSPRRGRRLDRPGRRPRPPDPGDLARPGNPRLDPDVVTGVEGVRLAKELGCSRVILARELSLREIAKIVEESELPVEVFVHGALCVAYSGQCLTSEALGGRSANRGECAQACRLPYEIVCDGEVRDLDDIKYLLSPQDLAAYDLVPELIELGVASLKIEGRLKTPSTSPTSPATTAEAIDGRGRPPGRVRSPRRPGDGALLLPRVQPRLLRRQRPQGPGPGRLRQEARRLRGRGDFGVVGEESGSTSPRPSSRATAWSSTATRKPGTSPSKAAGSTRSRGRRQSGTGRSVATPVGPEGSLGGPGRTRVRPTRPRHPPGPARPEGLEDRRPRADPPAPPVVRRAAAPEGCARRHGFGPSSGEPLDSWKAGPPTGRFGRGRRPRRPLIPRRQSARHARGPSGINSTAWGD